MVFGADTAAGSDGIIEMRCHRKSTAAIYMVFGRISGKFRQHSHTHTYTHLDSAKEQRSERRRQRGVRVHTRAEHLLSSCSNDSERKCRQRFRFRIVLAAYRFEKIEDGKMEGAAAAAAIGVGCREGTSCSYMHKCLPNALMQLLSPPCLPPLLLTSSSGMPNMPLAFAFCFFFYFFSRFSFLRSHSSFLAPLSPFPTCFRSASHFQGFVSFICINFHFPLTLTAHYPTPEIHVSFPYPFSTSFSSFSID